MKVEKKILFLASLLIIPSLVIPIYADETLGMTASVNKSSYQPGDKVIISGSVGQITNNNPVTIIIRNPMGNVYEVGQAALLNNLFVHDFVLNDDSTGGTYTVNIKYGTSSDQLSFVLNSGALTTIPVFDNAPDHVIKIRTNGTNMIKYGTVSVSTVDKTIHILMNMSQTTGSSTYQQYQIPKTIVDTPGGNIVLKVDGNQILCPQTETDTMRILDCSIPADSTSLDLVGTIVIPEFGPLAGLAILISIMIVVLLSRFTQIHFKSFV